MLLTLNMVHFHFTLSLRARLLQSWFLFPTVQPLFEYQGPLGFHGHGSWSMCKAALNGRLTYADSFQYRS